MPSSLMNLGEGAFELRLQQLHHLGRGHARGHEVCKHLGQDALADGRQRLHRARAQLPGLVAVAGKVDGAPEPGCVHGAAQPLLQVFVP